MPSPDVPRNERPDHPLPGPDLAGYRSALADLLDSLSAEPRRIEGRLVARLVDPVFAAVLDRTPKGVDGTIDGLVREVHRFQPNPRSSAQDLAGLVRVHLLSQIDVMWWRDAPLFRSDAEIRRSAELVDLERLRLAGRLRFGYRVQASTVRLRVVRAALRRARPDRAPHTIGLRLTLARPETVALLNQCADEFAKNAPIGTRRLWVNSLVRSVDYQDEMRALGYAAVMPSAHCSGWAVDVEMSWFRRLGVARHLQDTLLGRLSDGDVNVIDEGAAWHMCANPSAVPALRRAFELDGG
jgi:Family of unknown function (DUF5715)